MSFKNTLKKLLSKLAPDLPKAPAGLSKYNVVVVGSNIGGVFTKFFSKFDHGKHHVYVAHDQQEHRLGMLKAFMESNKISKDKASHQVQQILCKTVQSSEGKGVKEVKAKQSKIVLENGKEIEYDVLVMAQGLKTSYDEIQGLADGLKDLDCPVYAQDYYPESKDKLFGAISSYTSGDAYIYIPKMPFSGGVETYNFLYSQSFWDLDQQIGLVSPKRSLTIVNANDRFSAHSALLDSFLKERLGQ